MMESFWYLILGTVFTLFIVLDGFDFGAGVIYHFIAKSNDEKRTVLNAIGPIWDGNEVWLVITGGILFFAFPTAYASIFSGFYLALFLVLWLLIFRGLSMELRPQINNPLWHSFWDGLLTIASILISLVFGAALGNALRGVPIDPTGFFFLPLWTDFRMGLMPGILDWFTLTTGVFVLILFSVHGANFIALKTVSDIQKRARSISRKGNWLIAVLMLVLPFLSYIAQPSLIYNFKLYGLGVLFVAFIIISLVFMFVARLKNHDCFAFLASSSFIVSLMLTLGFALYPNLMIATTGHQFNLNIYNTATSQYALDAGLTWFSLGSILALIYTIFMYRSFRGKVVLPDKDEGY